MEQFFLTQLWEAVKLWFNSIDLVFMVIFMLVTWLINFGSQHPTQLQWLNWIQKIPQTLFVLILGFILAIVYAYLNDMRAKADISSLLYAILLGMVIYKLGFKQFEDWLKAKFWTKKD